MLIRWSRDNTMQTISICFLELLNHPVGHRFIHLVIWTVQAHDAVLFPLHFRIILIDWEIERSLKQAVLPRFINVKLIIKTSLSWQEIHNYTHCYHENGQFI